MIKRLLRQLRKQPKSSRDNVAFVVAGTLTAAVVMVWVYHAPARLSVQERGLLSNVKEEPGFWQLFSDFGSQMASVKDSLPELQNTLIDKTDGESPTSTDTVQRFYNSAIPVQENSIETISTSTRFLEPERTVSATTSQPIRIITVGGTATSGTTTSESW